jgi:hypothetical protein
MQIRQLRKKLLKSNLQKVYMDIDPSIVQSEPGHMGPDGTAYDNINPASPIEGDPNVNAVLSLLPPEASVAQLLEMVVSSYTLHVV